MARVQMLFVAAMLALTVAAAGCGSGSGNGETTAANRCLLPVGQGSLRASFCVRGGDNLIQYLGPRRRPRRTRSGFAGDSSVDAGPQRGSLGGRLYST